jgi:hypothetical protein
MTAVDLTNISSVESALTGCPDPAADSSIVLPGGTASTVTWILRDANGNPINLTPYITAPAGVRVYIANALCPGAPITTINATVVNPLTGQISFVVPPELYRVPGIYTAEIIGFTDSSDVFSTAGVRDSFLLSIEGSLLTRLDASNTGMSMPGPITLGQIRMQLRDGPVANEYWQNYEFSPAEIVHSLLLPIQLWNSTNPVVAKFDASNFPYRQQWLDATVANLMKISALWFLRNSRTIKYADGTVDGSDKDKFNYYYQVSEQKWKEYEAWCIQTKVIANLRSNAGIHGA